MSNFNINAAIEGWKKNLRKNPVLEEGYIEELETHLKDLIDEKIKSGESKENAFKYAVKKIGDTKNIGGEYFKSNTTKKIRKRPSWENPMFIPELLWNYIKSATRFLRRNKSHLVINSIGLTIGFICFILIGFYVLDEVNFDSFHKDSDKIYRVIELDKEANSNTRKVAGIPAQVTPTAKDMIPGVEDAARLVNPGRLTVGNDINNYDYEPIWFASKNFFQFFTFDFVYGDPRTALTEPGSVVLTESTAKKYFGKTDVVGKILHTNVIETNVTGVIKDFPFNSHISMSMLFSENSFGEDWKNFLSSDWSSNHFITYLKLKPNAEISSVENEIGKIVAENKSAPNAPKDEFFLQPLKDIHLYSSGIEAGLNKNESSSFYVYMTGIIGLLILLVASFNYMNLNIAISLKRTKEIAMRKIIGAGRKQIIFQYATESLILSFLSFLLALAGVKLILPYMNSFTNKSLSFSLLSETTIAVLLLVAISIGVVSIIYPSFLMWNVSPAYYLKNNTTVKKSRFNLRKILVILQFGISFTFLFSTIIIYEQLSYMHNKNLGFKVDNLLVVDINSENLRHNFESVKREFLKLSEVKNVTVSSRVPGEWKDIAKVNVHNYGKKLENNMIFISIDKDFLNTYGIKLLKGRNFTEGNRDSNRVILNSLAVKKLDLKNPIGNYIEISNYQRGGTIYDLDTTFKPEVIGVVDNFYFESFKNIQKPMVMGLWHNPIHNIDYYTLRTNSSDWSKTLADLKKVNDIFDPQNPLEYHFLDQQFERFYKADETRAELFLIFSIISIFIACLGLFALVSFSVERRFKEIGIRKVHGAEVFDIVKLISKSFALLVLIGCIIAAPFAYLFINGWLEEFTYRVSISFWIYAVSAFTALLIALATISFKTIKAGQMNPVETIRSE